MSDSTHHHPTVANRAEVSALVSFGNTQEEIARYLEISVDTLVKHYRKEIDNSVLIANSKVANMLFNKAVKENDFASQKFWLQTRAKWRITDKPADSITPEDTLTKIQSLVADFNKTNTSEI